jgi:D-alanyl-D-alanine carboxypeptidase
MRVTTFRNLLAALCLLLFCALPSVAQKSIEASIDRVVRAEMRDHNIPGLSIAVVRNGRVAILKSYGLANVEHRVSVKPETVFQSGSIAKQFTAAAVMILVEEGKISLDDKLTKYFLDAPANWEHITARHLLNHTSGMGDYPAEIDLRRDYTEEEYFEHFKKAPLAFEPGARWDYSNVGYVTLGILIRKVTGKFYGEFLQERIFGPLRMTTARVISEVDIVPNRAAGYGLVRRTLKNQEWVSPSTNTTADGSLYFSIMDLAKWDAALYQDKPLKQSSLAQVWTAAKLNDGRRKGYGFGWFTDTIHERRVVFHGGAWQGFKSFIMRFPDDKLTIIFLANSRDTREFKLARSLAAIFYPAFMLPALSFGQTIDDEDTEISLVRRVLFQLAQGTIPDQFLPELRAQITPGRVKQIAVTLNSLSLPVAIVHTAELIERRDENGRRIFRYLLTDIGKTLSCTVTLTKEDKIAGFELSELAHPQRRRI